VVVSLINKDRDKVEDQDFSHLMAMDLNKEDNKDLSLLSWDNNKDQWVVIVTLQDLWEQEDHKDKEDLIRSLVVCSNKDQVNKAW